MTRNLILIKRNGVKVVFTEHWSHPVNPVSAFKIIMSRNGVSRETRVGSVNDIIDFKGVPCTQNYLSGSCEPVFRNPCDLR